MSRELSPQLLEFIWALTRQTKIYQHGPKREGCLGVYPGAYLDELGYFEWQVSLDCTGYEVCSDKSDPRYLNDLVNELERNHRGLLTGTFAESEYVFITDSPEIPKEP